MVIGTFLSAPIMYVSAWLLSMPWMDARLLMDSLQNVSFNISIVSLVALVSSAPRSNVSLSKILIWFLAVVCLLQWVFFF